MDSKIDEFLEHGLASIQDCFDELSYEDRLDAMKVVIALKKLQAGIENKVRGDFFKSQVQSDEEQDDEF